MNTATFVLHTRRGERFLTLNHARLLHNKTSIRCEEEDEEEKKKEEEEEREILCISPPRVLFTGAAISSREK